MTTTQTQPVLTAEQRAQQAEILKSGDGDDAYRFVRDIPGADKAALQARVIAVGDGDDAYRFACYVPGADVPALQARVIAVGDGDVAYRFALNVPGADIAALYARAEAVNFVNLNQDEKDNFKALVQTFQDGQSSHSESSDVLHCSVFLFFEIPKDELSEDGDPVAVMIKFSLDKLVRLDATGDGILSSVDCRWLKGIAFTDGVLSDVPGFFKAGQDVCVPIGEAFLIDLDENNGVDFHGAQCECEPDEITTRVSLMSGTCDHFFVEGHDSAGKRFGSFIYPLQFILEEVSKTIDLGPALRFRDFATRTLANTSSLVALVNANELRSRAINQSLDEWLHQCLVSEFESSLKEQEDDEKSAALPIDHD